MWNSSLSYFFPFSRNRIATAAIATKSGLLQQGREAGGQEDQPLFDEIYAVGDSLSDSGGVFQLSSQALTLAEAAGVNTEGLQPIPVSPPYAQKVFQRSGAPRDHCGSARRDAFQFFVRRCGGARHADAPPGRGLCGFPAPRWRR